MNETNLNTVDTTVDAAVNTIANTATNTTTSIVTPAVPELNLYTNMGTSFILVIGLILVLGWLVKRSGIKKFTHGLINIKGNYAITAKERIVLVEVDNKMLVVGVTPQQMTLLHTIDEEGTKAMLSQETSKATTQPVNSVFHQILQSSLKRNK